MVGLADFVGHGKVFLVDVVRYFIVDCNLIFPISHVHKHAVVVTAFSFAHEVLAILHSPEQYFHVISQIVTRLHHYTQTRKARAAA